MRAKHHPHTLQKFPVYSAAWSSDDVVALGGGGGANSRTGIKNKVKLVKVSEDGTKLEDVAALELPLHDDTPMSLAIAPSSSFSPGFVAGINSHVEASEPGDNQNCRRIVFSETKAEITGSRNTISVKDAYQRVVVFFPSGDLVVTASTSNEIAILNYPSLTPACSSLTVPEADGELFDVTVNDTYLVAATTRHLLVYSWMPVPSSPAAESNASNTGTKSRKSSKKKKSPTTTTGPSQQLVDLKQLQKIPAPSWAGQGSTFRAARFATAPSTTSTSHPPNTLFTVVNAKAPKGRKFARKSFAARYVLGDDSSLWSKEVAKRLLGDMNISSFDVNTTGSLLAYGGSDCAIGVLDANSLAPLLTILHAHDFPATVVKFNPSANMLISASADDTCRIVLLPEGFANYSSLGSLLLIITILLAVLAVVAGKVMYA